MHTQTPHNSNNQTNTNTADDDNDSMNAYTELEQAYSRAGVLPLRSAAAALSSSSAAIANNITLPAAPPVSRAFTGDADAVAFARNDAHASTRYTTQASGVSSDKNIAWTVRGTTLVCVYFVMLSLNSVVVFVY
jgi:hypothetical protein